MSLPMQKAWYSARATPAPITFGRSKQGNVQISIECEILDAEYPGERMTWIGTLGGDAIARCIEQLIIAGWQGEDPSELEGVPASSALSSEFELACEPDSYYTPPRLKAAWINRPGGGKFAFKESVTGTDLKAFGAQLRATVQSIRAQGGAPRKPTSGGGGADGASNRSAGPHPNEPGQRDDIPFASSSMDHEPMMRIHADRWI